MENNIIAILLIIIIGAVVLANSFMAQKWKNFNRFLKVGDPVYYSSNGKRKIYKIKSVGEIFCFITDEQKKYSFQVSKHLLYPKFWYTYKPKDFIE